MTPLDIKIEMLRKGVTRAEIARRTGASGALVTQVIQGRRKYGYKKHGYKAHKIRLAVARAIGKPWQEVFTDDALKAA